MLRFFLFGFSVFTQPWNTNVLKMGSACVQTGILTYNILCPTKIQFKGWNSLIRQKYLNYCLAAMKLCTDMYGPQ